MWKDSVVFEELTVVSSADITSSFVAVVTASLPVVAMFIKNGTNDDVLVGIDGTTAKWGFPANSGAAYDVTTNSPTHNQLMLSEGTTLYVQWADSGPGSPTGNLYIELMEVST